MPKNTEKSKLFLDTSVVVGAVTKRSAAAFNLLLNYDGELIVNKYVLKESRRILKKEFGYSDSQANTTIDYLSNKCRILHDPSKEEFKRIFIRDKSDKPIVYSAMKNGCILVIDDSETYQDAKKYVETKYSDEVEF